MRSSSVIFARSSRVLRSFGSSFSSAIKSIFIVAAGVRRLTLFFLVRASSPRLLRGIKQNASDGWSEALAFIRFGNERYIVVVVVSSEITGRS